MKHFTIYGLAITALLFSSFYISRANDEPVKLVPILKIDTDLDKRTEVKPSLIPGAGNGLFAKVKIKEGEVIGHLGGRLRTAEDYPAGNHYIASIPECAWEETAPYRYLDSKEFGGNVRRINFAPSKVNGRDTGFQNAAIRQLCDYPYFIFVAIKDIEPDKEIWASYGPYYDYTRFMYEPAVRDFFCNLVKLDCAETYSYEH
ncbi:MAG: hypothetical protein FJ145_14275 [Deltaproteobacteria bacterium]|nr:hypothetical protein [Deltaproteobacteria bacterium]